MYPVCLQHVTEGVIFRVSFVLFKEHMKVGQNQAVLLLTYCFCLPENYVGT